MGSSPHTKLLYNPVLPHTKLLYNLVLPYHYDNM